MAELRREYAVRGRPSSLLAGAGTNRTEALGAINADRKDLKEQLRTLLGDSRYSQYTDYQQTAAERTQLNAYKQLSACDANLTDDQTEQLLAVN